MRSAAELSVDLASVASAKSMTCLHSIEREHSPTRSNLTIPLATWIGSRRSSELPLRERRQREPKILPATPHSELPAPIALPPAAVEIAYPAATCGIQASDRFPGAE